MVLKEVFRENFENAAGDLDAATPTWSIRLSPKDEEEYAPLNILWVFNDADEKLQVKLNGDDDDYVIVDPKTTLGIDLKDGISYTFIDIVNLDATDPAADEVRVRVARIRDVAGGTI